MADRGRLARRHDASPDTSFVQQGQVDWVAFGNTLVSASIATLQRLSGAGVQELTYAGALQLATRFRLGNVGQQRIEDAVQNLGNHAGFGNILYFGFGYRSFARMLAESVSGLKCLALCTCLVEMHSEDVSARILFALWTAAGFPDEYKPSISQFLCLVNACAGVISKSTFSETGAVMLNAFRHSDKLDLRVSSPEDIAQALWGLFEISTGARDQIAVVGGAECAFVAALSEWLFNFKTHAEDAEGNTIFTSCSDSNAAQVRIQYSSQIESSEISLAQSTFVLGDPGSMFVHIPNYSLLDLHLRVPWDNCFQMVLGPAFQILLDMPVCLGRFLGAWSRIYRAHACREIDFPQEWTAASQYTSEVCYGMGLIFSLSKTFPELSCPDIVSTARSVEDCSLETAISNIKTLAHDLRRECCCHTCSSAHYASQAADRKEHQFCILIIPHVILSLGRALTCMRPDPELLPTVQRFLRTYKEIYLNSRTREAFEHIFVERFPHAYFHSVDSTSVMEKALWVFSGYGPGGALGVGVSIARTAMAQAGICCYKEALQTMVAEPEQLRRVHIIPGHISAGHHIYDSVVDGYSSRTYRPKGDVTYQIVEGSAARIDCMVQRSENLEKTALVSETMNTNELIFYYKIAKPGTQLLIQPGHFTNYILQHLRAIRCDGHGCEEEPQKCAIITSGFQMDLQISEKLSREGVSSCIWSRAKSQEERVLVLENLRNFGGSLSTRSEEPVLLFRKTDCIGCRNTIVKNLDPEGRGMAHFI